MFKIENGRMDFFQWDVNQRLIVDNRDVTEVHFSNAVSSEALVCEVYEEGGKWLVNVPNILLQQHWSLKVYGCCAECVREYASYIVLAREKPADYAYTETEVKRYAALEERIKELEENGTGAVSSVNGKAGAVVLSASDVGALAADELGNAVNDALAAAKASGEFDGAQGAAGKDGISVTHRWFGTELSINSAAGTSSADLRGERGVTFTPNIDAGGWLEWTNDGGLNNPDPIRVEGAQGEKGEKGEAGADGVSCTHSWSGTVLTVTSASGFSSADLKGAQGEKGEAGAKGEKGAKGDTGAAGYSPVRGVDYWTDADKAEIKNYVDEAILGGAW